MLYTTALPLTLTMICSVHCIANLAFHHILYKVCVLLQCKWVGMLVVA